MNCLRYLLQLKLKKHKFDIFYNGTHCIGVNDLNIFDYQGMFKTEIKEKSNLVGNYLPIKEYHDKKTLKELFNLTEEEYSVL